MHSGCLGLNGFIAPRSKDKYHTAEKENRKMKTQHLRARMCQAQALSELSSCTRRKVGALILDPSTMSIISDGYNGPPRNGPSACGGDVCLRDELKIKSGEQPALGCYHAEHNAILNAARHGARTLGTFMICTTAPCESCAKAIYHAGITHLYVPEDSYTAAGLDFLESYGVQVSCITHGNT